MTKRARFLRSSLILAATIALLFPASDFTTSAQNPFIELAVDTAIPNQDGLLVLYGGLRLGGDLGLPVGAGDINGDGRADVIFCQMFGNAGPGFRANNGQVNFYISDGRDSGFVDAAQNPPNILKLIGANSGDLLGTSVATGDVNNDGYSDVAIGAAGDDGPGNSRFNAGAVYLVLGSPDFALNADLGAGGSPPPGVIVIYGFAADNRTGIWVDLGDVDGDGYDDIVMGTDQLSRSGAPHTGGACIIFGAPDLPSVIDLASPPPGVRMTAVLGVRAEEHWGSALHVGDLNNDGFADIAIAAAIFRNSASYVQPNDFSGHDGRAAGLNGQRPGCGELYVIYGSANIPRIIDLRNPPPGATHVIGAKSFDLLGSQIHSADINGDGRRELIIGALQAEAPDNRGRTGAVYVIYGAPELEGATIDLSDPDSSGLRITTIYGEEHLDCGGDSVRSFDINNDGYSDLFIGSPEHSVVVNGDTRDDAGDTKFLFGQADFLPPVIKLYAPPSGLRIFRLAGGHGAPEGMFEGGDEMSYRLAGGDVDGDGFVDYIANAMHADGFNNRLPNTGNVYIFSGRKLSAKLGMLPPQPVPAPGLDAATLSIGDRQVEQAPAGETGLRITVTGTGFRPDTEFTVSGVVVIARAPAGDPGSSTQRIIELDDNDPAIRRTTGTLVVRARHTNPPSELSNEVVAGRLTGPEITSIKVKRKNSGVLVLKVRGANFPNVFVAEVTDERGGLLPLKLAAFQSSTSLKLKISAPSAPPPNTLIRVRVLEQNGVQSNEFGVTIP